MKHLGEGQTKALILREILKQMNDRGYATRADILKSIENITLETLDFHLYISKNSLIKTKLVISRNGRLILNMGTPQKMIDSLTLMVQNPIDGGVIQGKLNKAFLEFFFSPFGDGRYLPSPIIAKYGNLINEINRPIGDINYFQAVDIIMKYRGNPSYHHKKLEEIVDRKTLEEIIKNFDVKKLDEIIDKFNSEHFIRSLNETNEFPVKSLEEEFYDDEEQIRTGMDIVKDAWGRIPDIETQLSYMYYILWLVERSKNDPLLMASPHDYIAYRQSRDSMKDIFLNLHVSGLDTPMAEAFDKLKNIILSILNGQDPKIEMDLDADIKEKLELFQDCMKNFNRYSSAHK